ncbi:MAG: ATP-grasp domain-containing protein [Oligoflexia bacterium]|nr:ATP-grasp domain-containing protein [Oligoflexia bacterium]
MVIAVLVPTRPGPPTDRPRDRPIGRAALALHREGITVVFGDQVRQGRLVGHIARADRWEAADLAPAAFYDRFPSQGRADVYAAMVANLGGKALANPPRITALCRDKLRTQQAMASADVPMPPLEHDPQRFADRLAEWGAAFLKPRFGSLGAGVRRVVPGDPLPARVRALLDQDEDAILQCAVSPPPGLAGRSVRVLAQRKADGGWVQSLGVARESATDPVVNASRGARLRLAADVLDAHTQAAVAELVDRACRALGATPGGDLAIEFGVDVVIDDQARPHLIEINSRPRGRLEKLAEIDPARFEAVHLSACMRPIRTLAAWAG